MHGDLASLSAEARFQVEALPYANDIFRTACRILGDRHRAEDVAQEVFFQAWKSFDRFDPGTNCKAWLYRILFHCVNHHRRKWYRFPLLKENEEFMAAQLEYPPPVPDKLTDGEILAAWTGSRWTSGPSYFWWTWKNSLTRKPPKFWGSPSAP